MGLTVDQREGAAVLPALELALLAEHLSLGQRDVLVAAAVVDGVDVVVDAHHRYGDAVDGDLSDAARRHVVEPADALGAHDIAPWSLASTAASSEEPRSPSGSWSNQLATKPSTSSRSAIGGVLPRAARSTRCP